MTAVKTGVKFSNVIKLMAEEERGRGNKAPARWTEIEGSTKRQQKETEEAPSKKGYRKKVNVHRRSRRKYDCLRFWVWERPGQDGRGGVFAEGAGGDRQRNRAGKHNRQKRRRRS